MQQPVPILIVGPSGVGKSTIIDRLLHLYPQLEGFKTTTTRPPRDPQDQRYHFVDRAEFQAMVTDNAFLEWTETHGNLYGTERAAIQTILNHQRFPVPSNAIDVKGVAAYRQAFPELLTIFVSYESLEELPGRLKRTRPDVTDEEIERRMTTAREEMQAVKDFEHVVPNREGHLDETVEQIAHILEQKLGLAKANPA